MKQVGKRRWVLVLSRGEEFLATVQAFLEEKDIRGGTLTGIGALRDIVLAYYSLEDREYQKRTFEEVMELGNLTGTIGEFEGKPFLHAHATVSGPELIAFSGHLLKAVVAVTAELVVTDHQEAHPRVLDEETGLHLFRFASDPAEDAR